MELLVFAAALAIAFGNGANDNFKGFATVWGSGTLGYRPALLLATASTLAGSLASLALAGALVAHFSGKGLVPDVVANAPQFLVGVAAGASVAIGLATRLGLPVSTTHALIGGLLGAGSGMADGVVRLQPLFAVFLLPLLLSPVVAALFAATIGALYRRSENTLDCACVVFPEVAPSIGAAAVARLAAPNLVVANTSECDRLHAPVQLSLSRGRDRLHILSACSICFARGVNDTPKLTALLLAGNLLHGTPALGAIAIAVASGGLLCSGRVARTMSHCVAQMDPARGLTTNLVTAALVLCASTLGLPAGRRRRHRRYRSRRRNARPFRAAPRDPVMARDAAACGAWLLHGGVAAVIAVAVAAPYDDGWLTGGFATSFIARSLEIFPNRQIIRASPTNRPCPQPDSFLP